MIVAKGIMVGNWLLDKETGKPFQVGAIDKTYKNVGYIPLTPEILEKCGFKKSAKSRWGAHYKIDIEETDGYALYAWDADWQFKIGQSDVSEGTLCTIQYLHELQNIIYALTGTELEITLP